LLVHLNEVSMDDLEVLLRAETQSHIVHCPRSHEYFGHSPFRYGKLRTLGFNICLGTDSLASNDSLSLFAEMRAFQKRKPRISPREILEMATVNPARALHQADAIGRIRAGFQADVIAVPCASPSTAFEEILASEGPVEWLMMAGRNGLSS
jgi:cytosine/adenosine deaminase-related metal-dependent hydrolase